MICVLASALLVSVLAFTGAATAHEHKLGDLLIEKVWARASIGPAKAGAVYLTIVNTGSEPDRLVGAKTQAAREAAPHVNTMVDGIMKMRPVTAIEVAPGEPTVLQPGGLHIMLIGLVSPLVEGKSFPLTLTFEKAGSIEVEVMIDKAGAMEPSMDHMSGS
jgi:periplasmic copper chaperone A